MPTQNAPLMELADEICEYIKRQGFRDKPRSFGDTIALATTELSEAYEATRVPGRDEFDIWYEVKKDFATSKNSLKNLPDMVYMVGQTVSHDDYLLLIEDDPSYMAYLKPEGAPYELADCIIRCLESVRMLGYVPDYLVARKMAYNETREFMHGKKI